MGTEKDFVINGIRIEKGERKQLEEHRRQTL